MTRKYIKNCTGDLEKKPSAASEILPRIIFHVLFLAFIGVSGYVLFFSPYLQIANVNISGMRELDSQDIKQTLDSLLQDEYFKIVPKNNFLLVSRNNVATLLKDNFKKIRGVTVTKKFPDSISIDIDERKSLLVWCASENCFLLDENGIAYNNADFNSPEITQNNLVRINDLSGQDVRIDDKVVDASYEQYVLGAKDALKSVDFEVNSDAYETPSNMADEIHVGTTQGMKIYFSTQFSLESALQTLAVVLKKEIPTDKQGEVEYIDLRSEGKVFYKFKSQTQTP